MLIYFLRGTLPWRKLKGASPAETWALIRDKKIETEALLTVGLPREFDALFTYARGLAFEDLPDYEGLRALFRALAEREGVVYDGVMDWSVPRPARAERKRRRTCRSCSACQAAAEAAATAAGAGAGANDKVGAGGSVRRGGTTRAAGAARKR